MLIRPSAQPASDRSSNHYDLVELSDACREAGISPHHLSLDQAIKLYNLKKNVGPYAAQLFGRRSLCRRTS